MNWPRWLRWLWGLRWNPYLQNGAAAAVHRTEAKLYQTQLETPIVEGLAKRMASLPADEFAERVVRAFGRKPS